MLNLTRRLGFSLVEMVVAIAVLGIIVAVATPSLTDLLERRRVIATAGELMNIISFSKSEAKMANNVFILHLETPADNQTSCARLSTSAALDTCGCNYTKDLMCKDGATYIIRSFEPAKSTGVSFVATADDWGPDAKHQVEFSHNTSAIFKNLHLTITGRRTGAQLQVNYSSAGLAVVCSPAGSVSGYPTC